MKKFLQLLFLLIALGSASHAAEIEVVNFRLDEFDGADNTPFRRVETDSTGITVTYDFDIATFEPDNLYIGSYWCRIRGFGQTGEDGKPSLLQRLDVFDLPKNTRGAVVWLLSCEYVDKDFILAPARPIFTDSGNDYYTKENVKPIESSNFSGPNTVVNVASFQKQKSRSQVGIKVMPVQFNLSTGTTRIYHKIQYRVSFTCENETNTDADDFADGVIETGSSHMAQLITGDMEEYFKHFLVYKDKTYLIITCDKYRTAVERFAELKRKYGYTMFISCKDKWTEKNVSDTTEAYYSSLNNLDYVLLFGSYNDIPSQRDTEYVFGQNVTFVSDALYASEVRYSEPLNQRFYLGRIPVNDSTEANNVVEKIENYLLNPSEESSYYTTGANISYFQESKTTPLLEERKYIECSEEIRDFMISMGYNVDRIYSTNCSGIPKRWQNGTLLPSYLTENFNWRSNKFDIARAFNLGRFYIFHRDHGEIDGWSAPSFKTNDLSLISNNGNLPVVFSINCLTGKFNSPNCFAEKLLKMKNYGCAGVLAASEVTGTYPNDVLAAGIFNGIFGGSGPSGFYSEPPAPRTNGRMVENTELGRMLEIGLFRLREKYSEYGNYHEKVYHVFGDPSMMMWTSYPKEIKENEYAPIYTQSLSQINPIRKECTGFTISFDGGYGYVVVYDKINKTTKLYKGEYGKFENLDKTRHEVYLYKPNTRIKLLEFPEDGNPEIKTSMFTLAPNPASSYCVIEYTLNPSMTHAAITVASISSGAIMMQKDVYGAGKKIYTIDVSNWPNGSYVVSIWGVSGETGLNYGTETIIVNH